MIRWNGMAGGKLYGRDTTRKVSSEHRGIVHGNLIPEVISEKKFRTDLNKEKVSELSFNDDIQPAGTEMADKVNVTFSKRTDTRKFTYNSEDGKYHTNDWKADVKFQNLIILMDETEYITTPYKKATTTYLNYHYKGGMGYYVSNGTKATIKWAVTDGKLTLTDESGAELKINKGKSYIGLASSNNEGKVAFPTTE